MTTRPVVVLYHGNSDYLSLNTMTDHWAAALARRGYAPAVVDVRAADAVARIVALVRGGRVAFFLSVNGLGFPEAGQGAGFYAETAAPLVGYFVDHPLSHHPSLAAEVPRLIASFPTPHHLSVCREHIRRSLPLLHLPHAWTPGPDTPWAGRELPLLFSGSLVAPPEALRAGWAEYGPVVRGQLEDMLAGHQAEPDRPLHEIVLAVLGVPTLPPVTFYSYFSRVDLYIRTQVRAGFIRAAARLPLTLCGRGWAAVLPSRSRIRWLGEQPVPAVTALIARSRIVLNLLPGYYESHERPFQAMALGAAAATRVAPWLGRQLGADAVLELPADPAAAVARVAAALSEPGLPALAARGRAALIRDHTWDCRLDRLLAAVAGGADGHPAPAAGSGGGS